MIIFLFLCILIILFGIIKKTKAIRGNIPRFLYFISLSYLSICTYYLIYESIYRLEKNFTSNFEDYSFLWVFPFLLFGFGILNINKVSIVEQKIKGDDRPIMLGVYIIIYILICGLITPIKWMQANNTEDWKIKTQNADVAIIVHFDPDNHQPIDKSNMYLLEWTISNSYADNIFVSQNLYNDMIRIINIDSLSKKRQIFCLEDTSVIESWNQLEISILKRLLKLDYTNIVLVCHDLQLQRITWRFERAKEKIEDGNKLNLIIPKINNVPFSNTSSNNYSSKYNYKIYEIFYLRTVELFKAQVSRIKHKMNDINK